MFLGSLFDSFRERFLRGVAREEQLERVYDNLYDQIAGLMQIQSVLTGGPVLKPLRHWALSPDAMAVILADLQERLEAGEFLIVVQGSAETTARAHEILEGAAPTHLQTHNAA